MSHALIVNEGEKNVFHIQRKIHLNSIEKKAILGIKLL